MTLKHRSHRYAIHGARVEYDQLTVWDWFRGSRIIPRRHDHEVLGIWTHGLEFVTKQPPSSGSHILMNVYLPNEVWPFVVRGVVVWAKPGKLHHAYCVRVQFDKCPKALAGRLRDVAATAISC